MKIKLNTDLLTHKEGDTIDIADNNGIPETEFWRKRLKDSAIDNCIEVVTKSEPKKRSKSHFKNESKTNEVNNDDSI